MIRLTKINKDQTIPVATLTLPFEQRIKSRLRVQLDNGIDAGIFLERGVILRDGALLRERAEIPEADAPALQVVFHQAQVIRRGMLYNVEQVHHSFKAFSIEVIKSCGDTDSMSKGAASKKFPIA